MLRLFATVKKELLILLRDRSGLAILFLMPMALVTIMALIQDAPFRDYQELRIPVLVINHDKGNLGKKIIDGLTNSKVFQVTLFTESEIEAKKKVAKSDYEIGISIPEDASEQLNLRIQKFVTITLNEVGIVDTRVKEQTQSTKDTTISVFFAPNIKKSFRNSVLSSIKQVSSKLETQSMLDNFKKALNQDDDSTQNTNQAIDDFINFKEEAVIENQYAILELNSVQHNVPAWTMFGMFFIVITLSGSIIKEREDGSYLRIKTMPGSYFTVMAGKIVTFLFVCLTQCFLMLLVGIYLLPHLGLPQLIIGSSKAAIALVAISSGLAATGYGVLVGTLFSTHQQSSTFGAVSVVILAALGGIWVPVYVMPEAVKFLAEFSPLFWGLSAFQNIFLSHGDVLSVQIYIYKLLLFFGFCIGISYIINEVRQ